MATAAAVVSISTGAMKPVLAKLSVLMGDEYKKFKGLQKVVALLMRELSYLDDLLEKMDGTDELDPQARRWRKETIEMSYNIEDHIDGFFDLAVKENDKTTILRKASQYLKTYRLAHQFHEIKDRVMEQSERGKRYLVDQCVSITAPRVVVDPRLSAPYKESASLLGIDAQKDELVNWAFKNGQELKFMSIVGIGGSGKTTLANEVYREVQGMFDCRAFVSVSQKPDMGRLLNGLLLQLTPDQFHQERLTADQDSHAGNLYDLITRLRTHLQDKRYFIVVDDLWDLQAWKVIYLAFPRNSLHSRVVITTRIETVARGCSVDDGLIHTMKPLSKANSRKLFFNRIFGSEDACPPELNQVSSKILGKCGGLPLAIISMASMLASQPLEIQLKYINNSLTLGSTAANSTYEDMMYILDLSYKNLPRHLKTCFLYLGSYPSGHEISRVDLVRRWVAEGFVRGSMGQDVRYVAESYFIELVNRRLIQPTFRKKHFGIFGCKVNGILLELIMRKCKEDNFLSFINDPKAVGKLEDVVIRRLTVVGSRGMKDDIKVIITTGQNLSKIRSLTILGRESNWIPPLLEFKFLRVLALQSYHPRFEMDLTSISQLSQLRYLKVEGNVMLPYQIRGLRLLQTLDLSEMEVDGTTLEIADVPCLSNLVVPSNMRLPNRIIGELKSLHTLHGVCLPGDSLECITGLGELNALSELSFYFPNYSTQLPKAIWMAAMSTSLEKLGNLRELHMQCGEVAWCGDYLSSLFPCFHQLEWLSMSGLTFSRVPVWIRHLQSLHTLWLGVKQMLREDVAMIGTGMPCLRRLTLRITGVPAERVVIGGSAGFRLVEYFKFDSDRTSCLIFEQGAMPELQEMVLLFDLDEWDQAAPIGLQHLPRLKKIKAVIVLYAGTKFRHNGKKAALVRIVFGDAAWALPTRPAFTFKDHARAVRPREEAAAMKHVVNNDPNRRANIVARPVRLLCPSEGFDSQQKEVKGQEGEMSSTLTINEFPTSSSRGAMGALLRKLDLLLDSRNQLIRRSAKKAIKLLKEDLEEINADLEELSMVERPNYKSRCWMHEVRELSYNIEDSIDNMMQAHTAAEAKMRISGRSPQLSVRRHVKILCPPKTVKPFASLGLRRTLILSVSSSLVRHPGFLKRFSLSWRHESRHGAPLVQLHQALLLIRPPLLSTRIAELRTLLWETRERHERYHLQDCLSSEPRLLFPWNKRAPASSSWSSSSGVGVNLVGVDGTRGKLTSWLIDQTEVEQQQLKVLSILGPAGVGKTALAKELYCQLGHQFECRAFVRVSRNRDMRRILGEILAQVQGHKRDHEYEAASTVDNLMDSIRSHLQDKRYFVVIDEMWDAAAWDIMNIAFPKGNNYSRIIITAEGKDVASKCYYVNNLEMTPLGSLQDSAKIFFDRVFGFEHQCPDQLKDISCMIIRSCGGFPLAITTVASLVASQIDNTEVWEHLQQFFSSRLTGLTLEETCKEVVNICYDALPQDLKTCLLYLNMYPEGCTIQKVDLLNQWIAEDFISPREGKQTVADSYFDELISRGMIQSEKIDHNDDVLSCTVHHIVFDLIAQKSKEENFITAIDYSQAMPGFSLISRRLSLHFSCAQFAAKPEGLKLSQVRSLAFYGLVKCMPSITEFKFVRVLILEFWSGNYHHNTSFDLSKLSILFHLRYLKVSSHTVIILPSKIQRLQSLETLGIDAKVSAVPTDILHLPGLLHLSLTGNIRLDALGMTMFIDQDDMPCTPKLLERLELLPSSFIFSRLPTWIGALQKLCILKIAIRVLLSSDIDTLTGLPVLAVLSLYVQKPNAESVVFNSGSLPALKYFKYRCAAVRLAFEKEALPNLQRLKLCFNVHRAESYTSNLAGIENLLKLKEITAEIGAAAGAHELDRRAAESALKEATRKHPRFPIHMNVKSVDCIEEESTPVGFMPPIPYILGFFALAVVVVVLMLFWY